MALLALILLLIILCYNKEKFCFEKNPNSLHLGSGKVENDQDDGEANGINA